VIALLVGVGAAFVLCIFSTPFLIRVLRARGIGQQIRDDGPFAHPHENKAGTPTMGGIAIVVSALFGYMVAHVSTEQTKFARTGITLMALVVGMAVVGFVDDYLGVRAHRNLGLRKRGKTAGILIIGGGFAALSLEWVNVSTNLAFTRPLGFDLGTLGWFAWAVIVTYATANAVNITDGIDGLAAKLLAIAFFAYGFIAFLQGQVFLVTFAFTVVGAVLAFLWYNAHPAEVFMGDTGSLALGAVLGVVALMTSQWLLLPVVGIIFVVETVSVIIQKAYRRLNDDKRLFRMAPIHHHFELSGWAETQVSDRFWVLGLLGAMLGIALALI
jgi:phospho-N-acetylmuramoyl-pentapeptide-transferase